MFEMLGIIKDVALVGIALIFLWDTLLELRARKSTEYQQKHKKRALIKRVNIELKLNSTINNIPSNYYAKVSIVLAIFLLLLHELVPCAFDVVSDVASIIAIVATAKLVRLKNKAYKTSL